MVSQEFAFIICKAMALKFGAGSRIFATEYSVQILSMQNVCLEKFEKILFSFVSLFCNGMSSKSVHTREKQIY